MSTHEEWIGRIECWLKTSLDMARHGWFTPIAPDGTPEGWRWSNWIAFTEDDALQVALLRTYGCICKLPLIGYESNGTPRCRVCNVDDQTPGETENTLVD